MIQRENFSKFLNFFYRPGERTSYHRYSTAVLGDTPASHLSPEGHYGSTLTPEKFFKNFRAEKLMFSEIFQKFFHAALMTRTIATDQSEDVWHGRKGGGGDSIAQKEQCAHTTAGKRRKKIMTQQLSDSNDTRRTPATITSSRTT